MSSTYLTTRWGTGIENPAVQEMRRALAELEKVDPEHPDCWLSDETGWTVAVHETGKVVLENTESDEGPWHMKNLPAEYILELWRLLQVGDIASLRRKAWVDGYGSSAQVS